MPALTLAQLRHYAIGRAIEKLGFVQADPIRAPARAQDLTLRHRVVDYRAGDLERRYAKLGIEEDFFVNYGFLPRRHHALMHPRTPRLEWAPARWTQARAVLEFVRERGSVHPREVDLHFAHGKTTNWFGGSSNASTQLLDAMHYRGLLRVARRDGGTRVYAVRPGDASDADADVVEPTTAAARMDALVDLVVAKYAPLPFATLGHLISLLSGGGMPQWRTQRAAVLARAKQRLAHQRLDGVDWYWPANEKPMSTRWRADDQARLLTPFDPVVWDRRRFELLWGWAYRFEAYTPAPKRQLGYYALPLLWHDRVIGWGNVAMVGGELQAVVGRASGRGFERPLREALDAEMARFGTFMGASSARWARV